MPAQRLFLAAALAVAAPLVAMADASPTPLTAPAASSPHLTANGNLVTTLKASPDFTILSKAIDATNMSGVLAATPGLTLFAPTDAAFKALPPAQLTALMDPKNVPLLQQVLTYHLVHLDLDTAKFKGAKGPVQSVEKANLVLDGSGAAPMVNNATIIQADIRASNGIIQVVDKVLIPADVNLPTASAAVGASSATSGR
ncbi:MAG TPA: fasciclin domain-containing protein [Caulobacteraceae bacterium]|jgi:uncharacterized surface protein with fasciclin (FAS1) repeats|nr:fasciclin domain-containing protein [Caulobacteraceae bacterium]